MTKTSPKVLNTVSNFFTYSITILSPTSIPLIIPKWFLFLFSVTIEISWAVSPLILIFLNLCYILYCRPISLTFLCPSLAAFSTYLNAYLSLLFFLYFLFFFFLSFSFLSFIASFSWFWITNVRFPVPSNFILNLSAIFILSLFATHHEESGLIHSLAA